MKADTVLIVDNVAFDRQLLGKVVDQLGMRSLLCNDGSEAIAVAGTRRKEIALMLLDLHMPMVDGISALGHFRAHHPKLPVIIVTSSDDPEDERACMKMGAAGYIRKPLDFILLEKAIRAVLLERSA